MRCFTLGHVACLLLAKKVIIEKSRGGRFLWTGIEIWAGFGPVGNAEKKGHGQIMIQGQKKIFFKTEKNIVASALKRSIK